VPIPPCLAHSVPRHSAVLRLQPLAIAIHFPTPSARHTLLHFPSSNPTSEARSDFVDLEEGQPHSPAPPIPSLAAPAVLRLQPLPIAIHFPTPAAP
jgi:hypothetical protein